MALQQRSELAQLLMATERDLVQMPCKSGITASHPRAQAGQSLAEALS